MTARTTTTIDEGAHLIELAQFDLEKQREKQRKPIDWEVCRRIFRYLWRYPRAQAVIALHAVMIAAIHSAHPVVMTETIRWTIEFPERWTGLTGLTPMAGVAAGAGAMLLLAFAYYAAMGSRIRLVSKTTNRVIHDLRHDVVEHVLNQDMAFFDSQSSGRLLSRATSDADAVRIAAAEVIPRTLIHGLMLVGLALVMFVYDWALMLILCAMAPIGWGVLFVFRIWIGEAYRRVHESFSRLTATIAESVAGIRVTKSFARTRINAEQFHRQCVSHRRVNMRAARVHGMYIPTIEIGASFIGAIILSFGGWRVANGHMDVSDLIGFLLCSGGFLQSIIVFADLYNTTLRAMAGGERIFALLDTEPRVVDSPDARPMERRDEGIHVLVEGLTFGYDPERPALRAVDLEARPGEVVALVGHTGSGKTTMVRLLDRLYDPTGGSVMLDGSPIRSYTIDSLHRQIALVLQDNFLFNGTVEENIRFGRPEASDDEVRDVCERLACLDILDALPAGLRTEVGERGESLSSGQRQLVCFARAMIADPRLLMLDEATSAVDTFTEHRLQIALERLMENRTSIVVAHRLSTIRRADTIVVLEKGEVVERGNHDELIDHGGRYATLYAEFVRMSQG